MPSGYEVDADRKARIIEAHMKQRIPVAALATGYNISRKTIYKWITEAKEAKAKSDLDEATV